MDFKINKRNEPVLKGAAACCATRSPRRVELPLCCISVLFRGEEGTGGKGAFRAVSFHANQLLITICYSPSGTAAKYSLYFCTLNINCTRMGDLIVRMMVTLL